MIAVVVLAAIAAGSVAWVHSERPDPDERALVRRGRALAAMGATTERVREQVNQ